MASEGNVNQSLRDKEYVYHGSNRHFTTGTAVGSASAFTFVNFSGTNTGFGAEHNVLNQRIMLVASGGNTVSFDYFFRSGAGPTLGLIYPGATKTFDGVNFSGIWVRTNAASQVLLIDAW